jgi:hypothetical protein
MQSGTEVLKIKGYSNYNKSNTTFVGGGGGVHSSKSSQMWEK